MSVGVALRVLILRLFGGRNVRIGIELVKVWVETCLLEKYTVSNSVDCFPVLGAFRYVLMLHIQKVNRVDQLF